MGVAATSLQMGGTPVKKFLIAGQMFTDADADADADADLKIVSDFDPRDGSEKNWPREVFSLPGRVGVRIDNELS